MTKRTKLFNTILFETKFVFEDMYEYMDEEDKKKIDKMTDKQLDVFINNNLHSMIKGFEAGIMYDWDVVANTTASNLEY